MALILWLGVWIKRLNQSCCCAEELADSEPPSPSADDLAEPPELSSQAAMDLASALASTDSLSPPDETPQLLTEDTELQNSTADTQSPPVDAPAPLEESMEPLPEPVADPPAEPPLPAVEPPCPSPVDLLPARSVVVSEEDEPLGQDVMDSAEPDILRSPEEFAEPQPEVHLHSCGHDHDHHHEEEEPDQLAAEPVYG